MFIDKMLLNLSLQIDITKLRNTMNIKLTAKEFEDFKRRKNPEVYTQVQINAWVEACKETLMKGDSGEANDIEKAEIDNFKAELQSFMQVKVISESTNPLIKGLQYDTYFVRPQQVEWAADEIIKSEDGKDEIIKARHGRYTNTALNRKMGRVGAEYGKKGSEGGEGGSDKGEKWKHETHYAHGGGSVHSTKSGKIAEALPNRGGEGFHVAKYKDNEHWKEVSEKTHGKSYEERKKIYEEHEVDVTEHKNHTAALEHLKGK